jgi:outer membrane protein assembly factor BamB
MGLRCFGVVLALGLAFGTAMGEEDADWPQFLGQNRDGRISDQGLNTDWKAHPPKALWKVPLGDGFSSFAVVGGRLYTMCERQKRIWAVCLDAASGKEVWTRDLATGYIDKQKQGAGPRSTPTYHEGKIYCLLPMGELFCLAAEDGKVVWSANEFDDTRSTNPAGANFYWGASLSPLIEGKLVIVQPGGDKNSSVAAYNKETGKIAWTAGNDPPGYASPVAVTIAGQRQVIVPTGSSMLGIDPASGSILWRHSIGNKSNVNGTTPIWAEGLLFVSAAYGAGSHAVEIARDGKAWVATTKWKTTKLQTLFANAMVVDGSIYACHGDLSAFFLKCVDLQTGEIRWEERMPSRMWVLAAGKHLIGWSERGTLSLIELQPKEYVQKGEVKELLSYKAWAAPAVSGGRMYLRDQKNALAIDLRK